jgi:hypothetical protein
MLGRRGTAKTILRPRAASLGWHGAAGTTLWTDLANPVFRGGTQGGTTRLLPIMPDTFVRLVERNPSVRLA